MERSMPSNFIIRYDVTYARAKFENGKYNHNQVKMLSVFLYLKNKTYPENYVGCHVRQIARNLNIPATEAQKLFIAKLEELISTVAECPIIDALTRRLNEIKNLKFLDNCVVCGKPLVHPTQTSICSRDCRKTLNRLRKAENEKKAKENGMIGVNDYD